MRLNISEDDNFAPRRVYCNYPIINLTHIRTQSYIHIQYSHTSIELLGSPLHVGCQDYKPQWEEEERLR